MYICVNQLREWPEISKITFLAQALEDQRTRYILSPRGILPLNKNSLECPPCVSEESRLSEEAEDEDSEKVFPPSLKPPPRDCCAVCENGVQTQGLLMSGCEAELSAVSADVLPLAGNHCPVLAPSPMEGTGLKATSVRGVALPFPASGPLVSWCPPKAVRHWGRGRPLVDPEKMLNN